MGLAVSKETDSSPPLFLPTVGGWRAELHPCFSPLSQYKFDVLISAGGGRFVPEGERSFKAFRRGMLLLWCSDSTGELL